jgi:putative membrane protein
MTQIAFARLAEQRASNGAVRGLASALVAGRTKDKNEASQLAESLRAHVPIASPEDNSYELRKLSGLSGPAFDKEYVGYTIADHKRRIDRYETQSKDKSAATATFAQKSLPALRDHLRRAEALSQSL